LAQFDLIGFSLPYESLYTNTLNVLDLAGIPLLSSERSAEHPLIIAGGQACYNPEPMVDFIDVFVIGEGEEVILEVVRATEQLKQAGADRMALLQGLSRIPGVYVPSLYSVSYAQNGTISGFIPSDSSVPAFVTKRIVAKLPPHPTRLIVPNIETVHDRLSIEIMRGCTRGCRFCHAGVVNRPVRQRPVSEILQIIEDGLAATGYEEIGLLSLSSSDHTQILELTKSVYDKFHDRKVSVSLPSLRIASFSVALMDELRDLRPSGGFTLAPEAATPRMRAIINKPLDDEVFEETVRTVFEHGWLSLKLYYMIGLPGETMEDVQAILDAGKRVLAIGRQIRGNRVRVHLSVGNFIPKPHTPFQWYPLNTTDELQAKLDLLKRVFTAPVSSFPTTFQAPPCLKPGSPAGIDALVRSSSVRGSLARNLMPGEKMTTCRFGTRLLLKLGLTLTSMPTGNALWMRSSPGIIFTPGSPKLSCGAILNGANSVKPARTAASSVTPAVFLTLLQGPPGFLRLSTGGAHEQRTNAHPNDLRQAGKSALHRASRPSTAFRACPAPHKPTLALHPGLQSAHADQPGFSLAARFHR